MLNLGNGTAGSLGETDAKMDAASEELTTSEILASVLPTPHRRPNLSRDEMRRQIAVKHGEIMQILGLDLSDDSLAETPSRVAKMYVDEIFAGLWDESFPKITVVKNSMGYDEMLLETGITFNSTCEHHFLPIMGRAHIAYFARDRVLGLSKFNRVVEHFAKRPQVQERATVQIHQALCRILGTPDVAIVIDAVHTCVKTRGINDHGTVTRTQRLSGQFKSDLRVRQEFMSALPATSQIAVG
jgi:GTP cyclohydrolase IA